MGHLEESRLALNARFEKDWQRTSNGELGVGGQDSGLKLEAATDPEKLSSKDKDFFSPRH